MTDHNIVIIMQDMCYLYPELNVLIFKTERTCEKSVTAAWSLHWVFSCECLLFRSLIMGLLKSWNGYSNQQRMLNLPNAYTWLQTVSDRSDSLLSVVLSEGHGKRREERGQLYLKNVWSSVSWIKHILPVFSILSSIVLATYGLCFIS
jgi:hypothetical protein